MSPYRMSGDHGTTVPRWTTSWSRFAVKVKRLVFWTRPARRLAWRKRCRWLEAMDIAKTGTERVVIRADNGSTIKNVYVNHRHLPLTDSIALTIWRRDGRIHSRMPRA